MKELYRLNCFREALIPKKIQTTDQRALTLEYIISLSRDALQTVLLPMRELSQDGSTAFFKSSKLYSNSSKEDLFS